MNNPKAQIRTWIKNYGAFRFGQSFNEDTDIENAIARDDLIGWICNDFPDLAFSEGCDIIDKTDDSEEVVEWSDEFFKIFNVIRAAQLEYGYGAVTIAIMDDALNDVSKILNFKPKHVTFSVDERGNITQYVLTEQIAQDKDDVPYIVPLLDEETGKEIASLEDVKHVVLRPGKFKFKGIPIPEGIWNLCNARACLLQSAAIHTAKVASGMKSVTIFDRGSDEENDAIVSNYELGLRGYDSGDTSILLYKTIIDGKEIEDTLTIDQGTGQFIYSEKLDMYHKALSSKLGIPKNWFDGIVYGTLGAEKIMEMLYGSFRRLQNKWNPHILEVAERWAALNDKNFSPNYEIQWRPLSTPTEKEQTEINEKKMAYAMNGYNAGLIDHDEARKHLGYDPKAIEKPSTFTFDIKDQEGGGFGKNDEAEEKPDDKEEQDE
jgi:hypothetical protein